MAVEREEKEKNVISFLCRYNRVCSISIAAKSTTAI
jgi:hypothetical protein